jgi:hypothetical protein
MKKNFYLFMAIIMLIATTAGIYLGFCLLEPSTDNLCYITLISVTGYGGSFWYWLSYKETKS